MIGVICVCVGWILGVCVGVKLKGCVLRIVQLSIFVKRLVGVYSLILFL